MNIRSKLKSNAARNQLYHHPLFKLDKVGRGIAQTDLTVINLTQEEEKQVLAHAKRGWRAWNEFFTAIERSFFNSPECSAPKELSICPDPQRAGLPAYSH